MDCVFIIDFALNFRTGFYTSDGVLIMDESNSAWEYTRTWALLDFISSMPPVLEFVLALLGSGAGGMEKLSSAKVIKLVKVTKVFKALRIGKFLKLLNGDSEVAANLEELITSSSGALFGKVCSIVLSSFLIAHLLACFMAVSGDGWLRTYNPRVDDDPASRWSWRRQYLAAIYWAFTTMTTVGYGDITPSGDMERIFCIFGMLIGVSFYSYIIASVSSMVSTVDTKNAIYYERMEELSSWMDHYAIDPPLKKRVRRFFKRYYADHSAIDDEYIMERLSPSLQEAISVYLLHDFVLEHRLFTDLPEGALWKVMIILRDMLFEEGLIVVQKDEVNVSLFILVTGEVVQERDGKRPAATLTPGSSFGELCLLGVQSVSSITVTAITKSKFFYIRRDAFLDTFSNLPEVRPPFPSSRLLLSVTRASPRRSSRTCTTSASSSRTRPSTSAAATSSTGETRRRPTAPRAWSRT
jgi:CRP-like cAMP-binding protein